MNTRIATDSDSSSASQTRRRRLVKTGLLGRLVRTRFFQVLSGNFDNETRISGGYEKTDILIREFQSPGSKLVDVFLFALLVVIAPLLAVMKLLNGTILRSWWVKYSLGLFAGVICLALIAKVAIYFTTK